MLALRTMRILAGKMDLLFCGPNAKAYFQSDTSIASLDPLPPPICEVFKTRGGRPSSESEACLRIHFGSRPRIVARAETTDYLRAFRRAFD